MAQPLGSPFSYFADSNGTPLAGGKVYSYVAGTGYATPKDTYTDSTGGTPAANPVVLDSAGRGTIWLDGSYGIVVKDSDGNTISSTDGIIAASTTNPFSDAAALVKNSSDPSKLALLSAASISTGTTRTYIMPDKNGTIAMISDSVFPEIQNFRLTLASGTPVTTTDVTGATTIYATPYKGKNIALYDGANWNVRSSAEFSLALGTLTSGKPYDVFCYDNSGTPTLEFLVWTDGTNRATALAYQDGVLVKSGASTRRYLGSFYTTATTTTEDSVAKRYLYNYYNRVKRPMKRFETTASWTYTTATWHQANASTSNQLNFLIGVKEDLVDARVLVVAINSGGNSGVSVGIGLDSTTAPAADSLSPYGDRTVGPEPFIAHFEDLVGVGVHYLAWLEYAVASGTTTWYGTSTPAGTSGAMVGSVMA